MKTIAGDRQLWNIQLFRRFHLPVKVAVFMHVIVEPFTRRRLAHITAGPPEFDVDGRFQFLAIYVIDAQTGHSQIRAKSRRVAVYRNVCCTYRQKKGHGDQHMGDGTYRQVQSPLEPLALLRLAAVLAAYYPE